jgi:hypothetical protein
MEFKDLKKLIDDELHRLMNEERKVYGREVDIFDAVRLRNRLISRLEKEFKNEVSV